MKLKQLLTPTIVANKGMPVREVFTECSRANIPALPFCTKSGRITGRITLKNILKISCLPDYMVESARILGEEMSCLDDCSLWTRGSIRVLSQSRALQECLTGWTSKADQGDSGSPDNSGRAVGI